MIITVSQFPVRFSIRIVSTATVETYAISAIDRRLFSNDINELGGSESNSVASQCFEPDLMFFYSLKVIDSLCRTCGKP